MSSSSSAPLPPSAFRSKTGPPKDYVPGLGRGAAGFTTRSDVGPAAAAAETGSGSRSAVNNRQRSQQPDDPTSNNTNSNSNDPLGQYDHEDDEADAIWDAIDARMQSKKRKQQGVLENDDTTDAQQFATRAKIRADFRELKDHLASVTEDEWAAIPDVGDRSLRYKQSHNQNHFAAAAFTPLTDSLLEQRTRQNREHSKSTLTSTATAMDDDATNSSGYKSVVTNMSGLSAARGAVLGMSLDKAGTATTTATATTTTTIDKTGYLTSLSSRAPALTADVGDISKARLLLKSVRDTNPQHGPGWIAAARVEEAANKPLQARKLIQQGCQACPESEDVWLEAARLHPPEVAKRILATAARTLPHSVPIFRKAAELEHHPDAQKAVLRKALEANPTSVTLWKAAIDLEDAENAKVLLGVAVEKVPHAVELWLALARLETYANAQKVLNRARKVLKADRSIWIAAAKLEESQDKPDTVMHQILERAVASLEKHQAVIPRQQWLEEAEKAEAAQAPKTSAAIVRYTIGKDVEEADRFRTWTEDAKTCLAHGSVATARAILVHALNVFPQKRALWMQRIQLERQHGTPASLDEVLEAACQRLPHMELFWLLRAKECWIHGHVDKARQVLTEAFSANPDSETVWLAAAKLEWENGEVERARVLLQRARERAPTARAFMKSALLEWEEQKWYDALHLIDEGIQKYKSFAKLYMMGGQICSQHLPKSKSTLDQARKYFQKGLDACPDNAVLWILASKLEEMAPGMLSSETTNKSKLAAGATKARSILEVARLKNSKNPDLWLESVRLERRTGNDKLAATLMAKALQECPASGILLAEQIRSAPRVEKKSKSANAIKRCPEDPQVIVAVAELFASERKIDKARKWFDRAVLLNPDLGDSWIRYNAFLQTHGTDEEKQGLKDKCTEAEPKHGELWTAVSKAMEYRHKSVGEHLELATNKLVEAQQSA